MTRTGFRAALLGGVSVLLLALPALAEGRDGDGPGYRHRPAGRALPPETRYRDPRYAAPRRLPPRLGPPDFLIHAYLPRYTETPMYNEPPARFPAR